MEEMCNQINDLRSQLRRTKKITRTARRGASPPTKPTLGNATAGHERFRGVSALTRFDPEVIEYSSVSITLCLYSSCFLAFFSCLLDQ